MKLGLLAVSLAKAIAVAAASCPPDGDNCARAVAGTFQGLARSISRVQTDCSSFQGCVVTPSPVTTTVTSTAVVTSTPPAQKLRRNAAAVADLAVAVDARAAYGRRALTTAVTSCSNTVIPAYALTACGGAASASLRFASACSCAGVSKYATLTLPPSTITQTVTSTSTSVAPPCTTLSLIAQNAANRGQAVSADSSGNLALVPQSSAQIFYRLAEDFCGDPTECNTYFVADLSTSTTGLYLGDYNTEPQADSIYCLGSQDIDNLYSSVLTCDGGNRDAKTHFFQNDAGGFLQFGTTVPNGAHEVVLQAFAACS